MTEWDEKYKDFDNQRKKSLAFNFIGGFLTFAGAFTLLYVINGLTDVSKIEIRWDAIIITPIILPIGIYIWRKGSKLKLKSNEKNFLVFWKAHKKLERFHERKEDEDMNNAISSVNGIINSFSNWFTEDAPKGISAMNDTIIEKLENKIIPLIEEKNWLEISSFSVGCMNIALDVYKNEIDQDFLNNFKERLDAITNPIKTSKVEIKKPSKWQEYPILKVFWIGIVTGIILFYTLTTYMNMESGPALIGSFLGGVALTAMINQGMKRK